MPRFTLIARLSDHLPLAASIEEERDQANGSVYKSQAKKVLPPIRSLMRTCAWHFRDVEVCRAVAVWQIIKQLNTSSPERCTIESSPYAFQYVEPVITAGIGPMMPCAWSLCRAGGSDLVSFHRLSIVAPCSH